MKGETSVSIAEPISIKDRAGNLVSFQGVDHYDASSLFSDTVDLPEPGYLYVGQSGNANIMLANSDTALVYTFDQAGIYPLIVKRIYSTSTTVTTAYIVK